MISDDDFGPTEYLETALPIDPESAPDDVGPVPTKPNGNGAALLRDELPDGVIFDTDFGNAHRLRLRHGKDLRHVQSLGWLVWDGTRFKVDDTGSAKRRVHDSIQELKRQAVTLNLMAQSLAGEHGEVTKESNRYAARARLYASWAKKSESDAKVGSCLAVASVLKEIARSPDMFDRDEMLLNTPSGTIELGTGACRKHHRRDRITKLAGVPFDRDAQCPRWVSFLDQIFARPDPASPTGSSPDLELIAYVKRALGYSLSGSTREQCYFVLYGTGRNGKTTLLETVAHVLGDYAATTPTDTLMAASGARGTENDLARLRGARFVSAVETGEGRQLDEARVKRITGGDTLTARFLFKEFFEFKPTFKIWMAVNDRPEIHGTDLGIWRRTRLIPFDVVIPEHEVDADLPETLRSEAPGILAWLVEGALEWRQHGLGPPPSVLKATEDWRSESNSVARFVEECCSVGKSLSAKGSYLSKAFTEWAEHEGEKPVRGKALARRLKALGFKQERTAHSRLWWGLSLHSASSGGSDEL